MSLQIEEFGWKSKEQAATSDFTSGEALHSAANNPE
jgi:hypothetical protein